MGISASRQHVGSEAGSYLRLIDVVYRSTLGLRVIKKKKKGTAMSSGVPLPESEYPSVVERIWHIKDSQGQVLA